MSHDEQGCWLTGRAMEGFEWLARREEDKRGDGEGDKVSSKERVLDDHLGGLLKGWKTDQRGEGEEAKRFVPLGTKNEGC